MEYHNNKCLLNFEGKEIPIPSHWGGYLVRPLEIEFLYYGEYDLRLEKEGYEPIMTTRWAKTPVLELPVVDLFAEVVAPDRESNVYWEFELEPRNDNVDLLLYRAKKFRRLSKEKP